jgi:photosystem II stability/assembly factor-like uncharacterized protein
LKRILLALGVLATLAAISPTLGIGQEDSDATATAGLELQWRNIGPQRGGRSIAVGGSTARPSEYYFGATGGGLWKTTDGGNEWAPVTDGQISSSSVGAVEVCPADPDTVYIGMGEVEFRGDIIPGDGIYKTTDGGETWTHMGLGDVQAIGRIRVDPSNCDRVFVAALGHMFGPSDERGVYRSTDGGETWENVLFQDDLAGAVDIAMDPNDPDTLYAGFWHVFRKPWLLESGGPGSGLFKSTDGGDTWENLTDNPGMPDEPIGKVGVSVSGADSNRVYAIIEAADGGVFSSSDAGATWERVNSDRDLRQRAFYYTRIYADPTDVDRVYVLNVDFFRSDDGGATFDDIDTPHGDNHDLWISPEDNQRMIEGNDGGANVSTDGGENWTEQDYSTAQIYHVTTTNDDPYLVCGAQQDSSTICTSSEDTGDETIQVGGGEAGYVAVDPQDSNVFYTGNYGGQLTRFDRDTGQARSVHIWPDNPMGHPAKDLKERFQWTFPIVTNPAKPNAVYASSQHVFETTNEGQRWRRISPDLTRADPDTLGDSGGPITKDQTSIEYYADVFTVAPSTVDPDVIWAGSDDGLVHVTRNDGGSWTPVRPPDLPHFTRVSMIEASPHDAGTAYLAAHRYRLDDFGVYLYKTHDFGRTWTPISNGIPDGSFLWSVREDPERAGLLYAGTQHGVYVSFDDGANWESMSGDLPDASVQDLTVKGDDLVIATHGRGFYILDDLGQLRELGAEGVAAVEKAGAIEPSVAGEAAESEEAEESASEETEAVEPEAVEGEEGEEEESEAFGPVDPLSLADTQMLKLDPAEREAVVRLPMTDAAPAPAPDGAVDLLDPTDPIRRQSQLGISYQVNGAVDSISIKVLTSKGQEVRTFTGLNTAPGPHTFSWNLRYPNTVTFPGLIFWSANTQGPLAPWGGYQLVLTASDNDSDAQQFAILRPPVLPPDITQQDIVEQFQLSRRVVNRTGEANQAVIDIRDCKSQIDNRLGQTSDPDVTQTGQALEGRLSQVEEAIYQVRLESGQDPLNFPIKLNNKIAALRGHIESADDRPTDAEYAVFNVLSGQLQDQLDELARIVASDVPDFNAALGAAGLQPISCTS